MIINIFGFNEVDDRNIIKIYNLGMKMYNYQILQWF